MWSINFEKTAMESRVKDAVKAVKAMAGKPVPDEFMSWPIGPNPRFTGATKLINRPAEYIAMGGHVVPERQEVFAKVRYDGKTTYRADHEGGGSRRIPAGSIWFRVA
jgi:hypothetical protein